MIAPPFSIAPTCFFFCDGFMNIYTNKVLFHSNFCTKKHLQFS
ncbi:conserved hypothetical protein [Listeria seeligeri FSL S4-171]|nr:conserved hypothetical protein [Listeria seeligeri FSL S4-171]